MPFYQSLMTALGWSLLDSIWQMAALWLAFLLLTSGDKRFSPADKHNLALLFVLIGVSWFVYSLADLLIASCYPLVPGLIPVALPVQLAIPWLSNIYLSLLLIRFIHYRWRTHGRNHKQAESPDSPGLQTFADAQARILGISRKVFVFLSHFTETAQTSGYLKPVILLPFSMLTKLSPLQLEAILTHELLHIRRNDYLIQMAMYGFRTVFFFNPFALLFYRAIARERELACDDGVLGMSYSPDLYAEALFNLEKFRQVNPGFSLAADGKKPWLLMERIRRLLGETPVEKKRLKPGMLIWGLAALFLFFIQQKKPIQKYMATQTLAMVPARFEYADRKRMKIAVQAKNIKIPIRLKAKEINFTSEEMPDIKPEMEFAAPDQAPEIKTYFAEQSQPRDYSNQTTAGSITEPVPSFPGMPFVPSMSFTYNAIAVNRDSIGELEALSDMKSVMANARTKTTEHLEKLEIQFEKNKQQFRNMEQKNRALLEWHKKSITPIIEKIEEDLRLKKTEINRIKIELQVTDEEIIHI